MRVFTSEDPLTEGEMVRLMSEVYHEQSLLLMKSHQALAELRSHYGRLSERFQELEEFVEERMPGGMLVKFRNVKVNDAAHVMSGKTAGGGRANLVQLLPVSSRNIRCIEVAVKTSRPLQGTCSLVSAGTDTVLASWTLDLATLNTSTPLRLAVPELRQEAQDLELSFDFPFSSADSRIEFAASYRKADPSACVVIGGRVGDRPLHLTIWDTAPRGAAMALDGAIQPDAAFAIRRHQLAPARLEKAELRHPVSLKEHSFALVGPQQGGGLLVHPVKNDITCAEIALPEIGPIDTIRAELANRHAENEGIEMAIGVVQTPFEDRQLPDILADPAMFARHINATEWVYLKPLERIQVVLELSDIADTDRVFVLSRIPEGKGDKYVWAVLETLFLELNADA